MTDRLPWFPCDPSKLLGALAQMKANEGYVYVVVLLRIYEVGGPCRDTLDALAVRTHLNRRIVTDCLDALFKSGKLRREDGGIMNPFAATVLEDSRSFRAGRSRAGQKGARERWKKDEPNQGKPDGSAKPEPMANDGHLHKQEQDSLFPDGNRGRAARGARRTTLPVDWQPTVADLSYASEHGFDRRRAGELAGAFADHHRSRGNRMADWDAAWRTWVRNEVKFSAPRGGPPRRPSGGGMAAVQREAARDIWNKEETHDPAARADVEHLPAPKT